MVFADRSGTKYSTSDQFSTCQGTSLPLYFISCSTKFQCVVKQNYNLLLDESSIRCKTKLQFVVRQNFSLLLDKMGSMDPEFCDGWLGIIDYGYALNRRFARVPLSLSSAFLKTLW